MSGKIVAIVDPLAVDGVLGVAEGEPAVHGLGLQKHLVGVGTEVDDERLLVSYMTIQTNGGYTLQLL